MYRVAAAVEPVSTCAMNLVASIHFLGPLVMVWAEIRHQMPHIPRIWHSRAYQASHGQTAAMRVVHMASECKLRVPDSLVPMVYMLAPGETCQQGRQTLGGLEIKLHVRGACEAVFPSPHGDSWSRHWSALFATITRPNYQFSDYPTTKRPHTHTPNRGTNSTFI